MLTYDAKKRKGLTKRRYRHASSQYMRERKKKVDIVREKEGKTKRREGRKEESQALPQAAPRFCSTWSPRKGVAIASVF
jgi:hypothetical protein